MNFIAQLAQIAKSVEEAEAAYRLEHPKNVDKYQRQREACIARAAAKHDEVREAVMGALIEYPQSSVEITESLGFVRSTVYKTLVELEAEGFAVRVGRSKQTAWRAA